MYMKKSSLRGNLDKFIIFFLKCNNLCYVYRFCHILTLYRRIFQLLEGSSLAIALKEQYLNNYKRYHHVRHTVGKVFSSRLPRTETENPIVLRLWSSYEVRSFASRQLGSLPSFAVYISRRFKLP